MFDFMGVMNNKYRKHEVKRLSLYISRVKFRPLVWRNNHPYLLIDRVEDISRPDQSDEACDISLYGYVRGTHLKPSQRVHVLGAGDFSIDGCTLLGDPLPFNPAKDAPQTLKKSKDTLLYAPMANVGRVTVGDSG